MLQIIYNTIILYFKINNYYFGIRLFPIFKKLKYRYFTINNYIKLQQDIAQKIGY